VFNFQIQSIIYSSHLIFLFLINQLLFSIPLIIEGVNFLPIALIFVIPVQINFIEGVNFLSIALIFVIPVQINFIEGVNFLTIALIFVIPVQMNFIKSLIQLI